MKMLAVMLLGLLMNGAVTTSAREKVAITPKNSASPVKEPARAPSPDQTPDVVRALDGYRMGMEALSVDKLGLVMDPELLVLEHGGKDAGWAAYRDSHIGEHMKEWKSLKISDIDLLEFSVAGEWAYAAQKSLNTIVTAKEDRTVVLEVTETFVLKRGAEGWKIKHLHVSLKKKS